MMSNPKWRPVTEERFDEMLGIMPPLAWTSKGFLVGEAWSHRECRITGIVRATFTAFAKVDGQHYEALSDLTYPEWGAITRQDILSNIETVPA